ncbi:major facilitator superfamily domain-containing protein [Mycena metata]|uniref:Major facilitator superfamily domain-containing protein n=1 Tax=Mycena metata TaxID=1033252 RepID=A0AAD7MLZ8_9AGAR|nr:major facilitator superfamily domain-containing protein [Mycena metata]
MSLPSRSRTRSTSPRLNLPSVDGSSEEIAAAVSSEDPDGQSELEEARRAWLKLPVWKRPAPWWLMLLTPLRTIIISMTLGPEVELYTDAVCRVQQPELERLHAEPNFIASNLASNYPLSLNNIVRDGNDNIPITVFFNTNREETSAKFTPCSTNPAIQAIVATLVTATATASGILTSLTVGWWGSFSDRRGRIPTLAIVSIGKLIAGLSVILVVKYVEMLPGGYWFLLVEAIIAGAVGGIPGETAVVFGYLSDVSTPEERTHIFSVVLGFILAGLGLGPLLGSFIIRTTHSLVAVFYVAAALRAIYVCLVRFLLPESRTTAQREKSAAKHHEITLHANETAWWRFQRLFLFLKPLSILWPEKITQGHSSKVGRRDWNLTLLVLSYGVMLMAASSLINQFLYAIITFEWDAEYLGYCISSIGLTRAVYLTLILPAVLKFAKKRASKQRNPGPHLSEREPLLSGQDATSKHTPPPTYMFDFDLARFSVIVDAVTFAILPFAPTGIVFLLFTALGSFGAGLAPAVNNVALELYTRKIGKNETLESGKLFGAISVVQAVFAHVLGPPLYGLIYAQTVASHPSTIFFVALGNSIFSLVLLAFVRMTPDVDGMSNVA